MILLYLLLYLYSTISSHCADALEDFPLSTYPPSLQFSPSITTIAEETPPNSPPKPKRGVRFAPTPVMPKRSILKTHTKFDEQTDSATPSGAQASAASLPKHPRSRASSTSSSDSELSNEPSSQKNDSIGFRQKIKKKFIQLHTQGFAPRARPPLPRENPKTPNPTTQHGLIHLILGTEKEKGPFENFTTQPALSRITPAQISLQLPTSRLIEALQTKKLVRFLVDEDEGVVEGNIYGKITSLEGRRSEGAASVPFRITLPPTQESLGMFTELIQMMQNTHPSFKDKVVRRNLRCRDNQIIILENSFQSSSPSQNILSLFANFTFASNTNVSNLSFSALPLAITPKN